MRTATKFAAVLAALATLPASTVAARPVELPDAGVAPDYVRILKPNASAMSGVCRDEATDIHAYTGTGGALGDQQRVRSGWRWRGHTGYVLLRTDVPDGPAKWENHTTRPVLLAVWCS